MIGLPGSICDIAAGEFPATLLASDLELKLEKGAAEALQSQQLAVQFFAITILLSGPDSGLGPAKVYRTSETRQYTSALNTVGGEKMTKLRLVASITILTAVLLGAFGKPAQAGPQDYPWCWDDYRACAQAGGDLSDCLCYYQICIGGSCP